MAAATFDAKNQVDQGRAQTSGRVEINFKVDFAKIGDGTGLAATEDAEIGVLPAGYVHERLDAVLRKAEGEVATMDVGVEADDNGFGVTMNVNGTINAEIAPGAAAFGAGKYFHVNTPVRVKCPAAANTLNVAQVELTWIGYLRTTEF